MRGDGGQRRLRLCCANHPSDCLTRKQESLQPPILPPLPAAALLVLLQHPLHQTCSSSHSPCSPQLCCCPTWWAGRPCWSCLDPQPPGQTKPLSVAMWDTPGFGYVRSTHTEQDTLLAVLLPRSPRCINYCDQNFRDHWLLLWRQMLSCAKDSWNMQMDSLF